MAVRLLPGAAVCLLAVALAGCGGSGGTGARRTAVNDYITRVNGAEGLLLKWNGEINIAFAEFKLSRDPPAEVSALAHAHAVLRTTLDRVRAIAAPPDAKALRAHLVRLFALETSVADELVLAARFVPRFETAVAPLRSAAARLGREIAAIRPPTRVTPSVPSGLELWTASGCGACHTLAAARSTGAVGPNLDLLRPSSAVVAEALRSGAVGMPSYATSLSPAESEALAAFVAARAGKPASSAASSSVSAVAADAEISGRYANAFARYRVAIARVEARVARLSAPPLLRPVLATERTALSHSAALSAAIVTAFSRQQLVKATAGIDALFAVASGLGGARTRNAQARAARAYDARLARISALTRTITAERQRLVQLIG